MHRPRNTPRCALFVVLVPVVVMLGAGCGSEDASPTTSPVLEMVQFQVVVDEHAASLSGATSVEFAVARRGVADGDVVHTHPFTTRRDTFDLDLSDAIGVDVIVGDSVVVPLNRAFWEANAAGPIVVRIQRAGVMVRRKIIGPGGCRGDDREASRCDTVADKQHLPLPLAHTGHTVLPVRVVIAGEIIDDVGSGPLVIETVPADTDVGDVLAQHVLAGSTPVTELVLDAGATLRFSVGGTRVVDVPPEVWQRSWGAMTITYHADVAVIRRRVAEGSRLRWKDVRLSFDVVGMDTS